MAAHFQDLVGSQFDTYNSELPKDFSWHAKPRYWPVRLFSRLTLNTYNFSRRIRKWEIVFCDCCYSIVVTLTFNILLYATHIVRPKIN